MSQSRTHTIRRGRLRRSAASVRRSASRTRGLQAVIAAVVFAMVCGGLLAVLTRLANPERSPSEQLTVDPAEESQGNATLPRRSEIPGTTPRTRGE
jgi:hypothetical protein